MSSIREASANAHAAVRSLHAVRTICRDLMPLDQPMTAEQQRQRARLIYSALLARKRMELLRNRAETLAGALTRFRERQGKIGQRA